MLNPSPGCEAPASAPDRLSPLRAVLNQLEALLGQIDARDYCTKPVTTYGGSVGGHVRHCLDHVVALLGGVEGGLIDYENRRRGGNVESDLNAARAELNRVNAAVGALTDSAADRAVTIAVLLDPSGPALRVPSTVAREVAFVVSHTVHHHAMIGGMVQALGGRVPTDFGVAAGTLRHQQQA